MATTEEHEPSTVEEALTLGAALWGEERFFEAHECLEVVWHAAPPGDEDLWQGVIQVAVAGVHLQRGNPGGAASLLERAGRRLGVYPDGYRGIEVATTRAFCEHAAATLRGSGASEVRIPSFPAVPDGAWFTPDRDASGPPATPTPVPDRPSWLAAARPRTPRRRVEP